MKVLLTVLAIALLAPVVVFAAAEEHEMFKQLCVLLELNNDEQKKLAVAFVNLEENLDAATAGVGDKNVDPADMIKEFNAARRAFRDSVSTFLSPEQFESMLDYSNAIVYELADDIAGVRVKKYKESLKLTDDQISALTLVVNEDLRSVAEAFLEWNGEGNQPDSGTMIKSLQDIREHTRNQVKKILTEDQWAKLLQMNAKG